MNNNKTNKHTIHAWKGFKCIHSKLWNSNSSTATTTIQKSLVFLNINNIAECSVTYACHIFRLSRWMQLVLPLALPPPHQVFGVNVSEKALLKPCPNRKYLVTKHNQGLFGDQTCWCWTEWPNGTKHVWTTDRNVLQRFIKMPYVLHQTLFNTTKQGIQTGKCLVIKQCVLAVWSPNISRLHRAVIENNGRELIFLLHAPCKIKESEGAEPSVTQRQNLSSRLFHILILITLQWCYS